jgi:lipopolysaccharide export system permease protein
LTILDRHILRAHLAPFSFGFLTVIFVFLLQFLTRTLDRFVGKGLETTVIIELILLQIAWMVVLAAPMGVLIACLMAFGKLTNDLEITAMRAGGISVGRLMIPVMIWGMVVTVLTERFGNVVLPEANHRAKVLMIDISRKKPSFGLQANTFSNLLYGYSILARQTSDTTSDIGGVTIYDYSNPQKDIVITAERGKFEFSSDYRYLVMTLNNGEMHDVDKTTRQEYQRILFQNHKVLLRADGFGFERSDEGAVSRGDRELSAMTMKDICDSLQVRVDTSVATIQRESIANFTRTLSAASDTTIALSLATLQAAYSPASETTPDTLKSVMSIAPMYRVAVIDKAVINARNAMSQTSNHLYGVKNDQDMIRRYMVEVHKKYSIPFACFCFVLVGVPLGVLARRGGFGSGAGLSLAFFLLYWVFLIGGERLADRNIVSPAGAMWIGNIILIIVGAGLYAAVSGTKMKWLKGSGR